MHASNTVQKILRKSCRDIPPSEDGTNDSDTEFTFYLVTEAEISGSVA
jgi:hypothetical protein